MFSLPDWDGDCAHDSDMSTSEVLEIVSGWLKRNPRGEVAENCFCKHRHLGTSIDEQLCVGSCYLNENVGVTVIIGCGAMLVAIVQHYDVVALIASFAEANSVEHFVVSELVAVIQR